MSEWIQSLIEDEVRQILTILANESLFTLEQLRPIFSPVQPSVDATLKERFNKMDKIFEMDSEEDDSFEDYEFAAFGMSEYILDLDDDLKKIIKIDQQ